MNKLTYSLAVVLAVLSAESAQGQTIFQGKKGPTNFQLDERISFSRNEQNVNTMGNNLILKYWDEDKWVFVNVPYRFIETRNGSNQGLGDVSFGVGPRGVIGNAEILPYLALTLPTGETKGIATGNGKLDKKVGVAATYLFYNKNAELTSLLEYNNTGRNYNGINQPNEISVGGLVSYKIDEVRVAIGLTGLVKGNEDFLLSFRNGIRYTLSPRLHFEFYGDVSIDNKTIPKNKGISAFVRYNF